MNINGLEKILKKSWSKETCHLPLQDRWNTGQPEIGQCAVTVLVIQDYFGGKIAHDIKNKHYWNIVDGVEIDITRKQFPRDTIFTIDEFVNRESLFSIKAKTRERYEMLLDNIKNNSTQHFMNLKDSPFNKIKNDNKIYEIRLNDEKRQRLNIGDIIEFKNGNKSLNTKIIDLQKYKNISEMKQTIDNNSLGLKENENIQDILKIFYTEEKIKKYGILAIKIKLI